jgi:hypothetical protein
MPPQQGDGLLDIFDIALDFGAHGQDIGRVAGPVKAKKECQEPGGLADGNGPIENRSLCPNSAPRMRSNSAE